MIHHIEQSSLWFEFWLQVSKFGSLNAAHPDVYLAITFRHIVIGRQDADHPSAKLTDNIGNFLDGSRSVFHLKPKLNTFATDPGEWNEDSKQVRFGDGTHNLALGVNNRDSRNFIFLKYLRSLFHCKIRRYRNCFFGHKVFYLDSRQEIKKFVDFQCGGIGCRCLLQVTVGNNANQLSFF